MRRTATLLLFTAATLLARPTAAQLSVEVRGGAGAGAYEATRAGFQNVPQAAFAANVAYAPSRALAVYAGYSRAAFGCEEGFCQELDPTFTTSGVSGGLRFQLAGFWGRLGVARHQLAISSPRSGAPYDDRSDAALGAELGLGYGWRLGPRLSLTPGIGYLRYRAPVDGAEDGVAVLTADVGLRLSF
jgi:hypothetical protein